LEKYVYSSLWRSWIMKLLYVTSVDGDYGALGFQQSE
jgi:hypothetical protein